MLLSLFAQIAPAQLISSAGKVGSKHAAAGSVWDTGRPRGLATCCLLWGEEEALSGLLSSINSRMESGWSQQAAKSALFF